MHESFPYRSASERRAKAERDILKLKQEGYEPSPVEPFAGRAIATSFWGQAWCRHLEEFVDEEFRLERGRSYVRNGAVCHLEISEGKIQSFISGSELYEGLITIDALPAERWEDLKSRCSGSIGSLIDLLQGKLSDDVMSAVTDPEHGLFPSKAEIRLNCTCPDWANLCKHMSAVLYGVGIRLDTSPELLFKLRGVDHRELIQSNLNAVVSLRAGGRRRLAGAALSDIFGVEIAPENGDLNDKSEKPIPAVPTTTPPKEPAKKRSKAKQAKKKPEPRSLKTGSAIRRLRRSFAMSEYEFGLMMDTSAVTIANWEAFGRSNHDAPPQAQDELATIATLSPQEAQKRLEAYR